MSSKKKQGAEPEMREVYDFSQGVRGKYAERSSNGCDVIVLDPDVAEIFGDPQAVNDALRTLARSARKSQEAS